MTKSDTFSSLADEWDSHYKVPVVRHVSLSELRLRLDSTAVHSVRLSSDRTIDFYAKLAPSETLFVSLHGAVPIPSPRYPHFRRVESMKDRVPALLCIADPTLQLLEDSEFRLGWYTGGQNWDPTTDIVSLVEQCQALVGATRVMFLGSSGGGFASLRLAPHFLGSMAFVQDPQTDVASYYAGHRDRLIRSTWPGWDIDSVFTENPSRFNMLWLYSELDPSNYVYYRQATSDEWHLKNHAEPFKRAIAQTSGSKCGRFRIVYESGERPGHGKITPAEFDTHFEKALEFWD